MSETVAWWKPLLYSGTLKSLRLTERFEEYIGIYSVLVPHPLISRPSFHSVRQLILNDDVVKYPEFIQILEIFPGVEEFALFQQRFTFGPSDRDIEHPVSIPDHIFPRLNTIEIHDQWLPYYLGSKSAGRPIRHVRLVNGYRGTREAGNALRKLAVQFSESHTTLETLYIRIMNVNMNDPILVLDPILNQLPDLKVGYIQCPVFTRSAIGAMCKALADESTYRPLCERKERKLASLIIGSNILISKRYGEHDPKNVRIRYDHVIHSICKHCPHLKDFLIFGFSSYLIWPECYRVWEDKFPLWYTPENRWYQW
ncbi:hypothetical protein ABKN59_011981 [Abortiporus biennis]